VMEREDSQAILAELDLSNLFLIPLDDERRWFRYHHLFTDLLRSRLNQTRPDRAPPLHLRASEWYEQNGLIAESVSHALAAGDIERVARLVERNALAVMGQGELTGLVERLDSLPGLDKSSKPWITLIRAWALAYSGHLDAAALLLREIEEIAASDREQHELQRLTSRVTSLRAYIAGLKGDVAAAAQLAQTALEQLPEEDLAMRGYVASLLGSNLREGGKLEAAAQALTEGASISLAAGDIHVAVMVRCRLASLELIRGQYRKAADTCRDALQLAREYVRQSGRKLPVTGYAHLRMSQVLFEWNQLDDALRHAQEGVRLSSSWGQADILGAGYLYLSNALQARGDADGALEAVRNLSQIWSELPSSFGAMAAAQGIQIRLAQRDLPGAVLVFQASGLGADDEFIFRDEFVYRVLAYLFIAQGKQEQALRLLGRLLPMSEAALAMGSVIRILVLKAMALISRDESDPALIAFERALSLGEPEGCVRSFIDQGPLVGELLRRAAGRRIAPKYVKKLLLALGEDGQSVESPPSRLPLSAPFQLDPFSERELQVLRLLATSLSTTEIAEELFVAPSTVRTHVKNIYSKLDVHKRVTAVQRAQQLGLLKVN